MMTVEDANRLFANPVLDSEGLEQREQEALEEFATNIIREALCDEWWRTAA